jgi:hypothetical protein
MEVSGELHSLAALPPRWKTPRYPLDRKLGGPQSRCGLWEGDFDYVYVSQGSILESAGLPRRRSYQNSCTSEQILSEELKYAVSCTVGLLI